MRIAGFLIVAVTAFAVSASARQTRDYTKFNVCEFIPGDAIARAVGARLNQTRPTFDKNWSRCAYLMTDATGKPKNKYNVPTTDFEKKGVEEMKAGKAYYEEVGSKDGKAVLRVATVVPAVMPMCAVCHGGKEGRLLGAIIYEVPIK